MKCLIFCLSWMLLSVGLLRAYVDDAPPPISITSLDEGTTYARGMVKKNTLVWNDKTRVLSARVVFTDADGEGGSANDDTLDFRLPGITYTKGVFYARTAQGEAIPFARMKMEVFLWSVQLLPNATVRVHQNHGTINVILEANWPAGSGPHAMPVQTPAASPGLDTNAVVH